MSSGSSLQGTPLPLRFRIEYFLAEKTLSWIDRTSVNRSTKAAGKIADLWYVADIRRRKLAIRNIMTSGITEERSSAARIARNSFRHFGVMLIES
ncbi:MAG: hypothetical protein ACOC6C_06775, partial [Verrucomicrobiota bacterium]